ncbi:MAG: methyltransferase domain-containing protein [Muribaculaceae bacterium]|nr:methyltransferase domain-containing protein [Muribaculaceae bacterium]
MIYQDKNKTPEQSSLLERPNFAQYPTEQELSGNEVTQSSSGTQESGAENDEAASEEYIGQVLTSLAGAYESLAKEAQKEVTNNLDNFKAEVASRTDEEIATAIADIESTPILGKLFERIRNGLLSGEIKRTEQEEQELINALQRIAQGNVARVYLLPILKEEQRKRAEKATETAPQQEQEQPELQARLNELKRYTIGELKKVAKNYGIIAQRIPHKQAFYQALQNEANRLIKVFEATKRKNEYGIRIGNKPNTFDSLDKLFQALNKDEDIKALYDKVAKIFKELPIDIIFTDAIGKGPTQGKYSHKGVLTLPGHIVYTEVFPAQETASIILHEMIHAVTVQAIKIAQNEEYFADRGITLTSGMKEAVKILEDIHNRLKHNAIQGEYGATNVKEFVAELSNLKFRAKLKEANLWDKVVSAIKKLFGIDTTNALDGSSRALEYLLDNFDSNVWEKYTALIQKSYNSFSPTELMVSSQIDELYPNWLDGTTTDSGKHSTQVEGTRKTYGKVGTWIEENLGKNVAILDASSGMGYGTADLRERGFNIEDVEPYQSEERKQNNPATYSSYADIQKRYDFIISNAVLNVIPDDWRSNVLHDMAERLKTGGRMFINTRKAG